MVSEVVEHLRNHVRHDRTSAFWPTQHGSHLEKNWKNWRQLWGAISRGPDIREQDKSVQIETLTLALGPDTLDLLNSLPYVSESERRI